MNTIEKESLDKTGLRSDVVTLYQRRRSITSIATRSTPTCGWSSRPEQDIAFFGGDPDNFEYPRFDLDVCFFRVYENGKPAQPQHYLKWNPDGGRKATGVRAGQSGHHGSAETVRHLEFVRDLAMPYALDVLRRREALLRPSASGAGEGAPGE